MEALIARVKAVLFTPQTEWPVIAGEPGGVRMLFQVVAILALIPALARFVGASLIGNYVPIGPGLAGAVVSYGLSFAAVYVVALIIHVLAPTFGAQKHFENALKLSVYSHVPLWLSGIFLLIPGLSFLTLLGLYGFYVLATGLPPLLAMPRDKTLPFAAAIVACALMLAFVFGAVPARLFG